MAKTFAVENEMVELDFENLEYIQLKPEQVEMAKVTIYGKPFRQYGHKQSYRDCEVEIRFKDGAPLSWNMKEMFPEDTKWKTPADRIKAFQDITSIVIDDKEYWVKEELTDGKEWEVDNKLQKFVKLPDGRYLLTIKAEKDGNQLESIAHQEDPWIHARKGCSSSHTPPGFSRGVL